ncbi:MAG: alkaline phosphatase [Anaerolineae bacterium]|nr:MAG: alkaline phosphatase [Anaerolineae bacterium]
MQGMPIAKLTSLYRLFLILLLLAGCAAPPAPAGPTATPDLLDPLQAAATGTAEAQTSLQVIALSPTATLAVVTLEASATAEPVTPTAAPTDTPSGPQAVHGIILFIGDGLGEYHRLGAQWLAQGQAAPLAMDSLPIRGYQTTAAADRAVTDSAAAATAIATGVTTNYTALGVDVNNVPLSTILEQAQELGWAVGLVTNDRLAGATPGAFAAHVPNREMYLEIARQMLGHEIDVLLGGGEDDFTLGTDDGCGDQPGHRGDASLVQNAIDSGYTFVCTAAELAAVDTAATDKLLGLFADDVMTAPTDPPLAEMTRVAIEILSRDPNGFFLMVENAHVDHFSHDMMAAEALRAVLELNAAVVQAQVYALGAPDTLIMVTGDHETGGMSLNLDGARLGINQDALAMPDGTAFYVNWAGGSHTGVHIPVTAQGPYSDRLTGEYPNTWLYDVMRAAMLGE